MLLTISTTHKPAGDLGYLLHKHPDKVQAFSLAFGTARVFYPESSEDRCTAALLLDVDPVALVRGHGRTLDQYVNDRPYVASSLLSVAIAQVFGTALAGNCKARPDLVTQKLPLTARLAAIPCRGGEGLLRRLFEPLGYAVNIGTVPLDASHLDWGDACVLSLELRGEVVLSDLLSHLYVLIPVLDNDKHYWVGDDEVDKLLRHGEGWLPRHPERDLIATRYLKYRRQLLNDALRQLREQDGESAETVDADAPDDPREEAGEHALSLHQQRHGVILSILQARKARSIIDLGCGEGRLIRELLKIRDFEKIAGMDVSHRALQIAADRLKLDSLPPLVRQRLDLFHGSLMYRDSRMSGFDAGILCEVIEHMDPPRLAAMERVVFEHARPKLVLVTTPNREYNVKWASLPAGQVRHRDHRFEWSREEFRGWAAGVCARFRYAAEFRSVGDEDLTVGAPTQMAALTAD